MEKVERDTEETDTTDTRETTNIENIKEERKNIKENREDIRRKIKSKATDLCTYVVNTCVEYKEELIKLEKDNLKLTRKNMNLEKEIINLKEQNEVLYSELLTNQDRVTEIIKRFGVNNICYNCDHFLECGNFYLCIYCKKWICDCCIDFCRGRLEKEGKEEKEEKDALKDEVYCNISICDSCYLIYEKCPSHLEPNERLNEGLTDELCFELNEYYRKNKYFK
jgi:hypothetical protein